MTSTAATPDRETVRQQARFVDFGRLLSVLTKIREWIDGGERVALTCFEHLPHQCHRHCVAEALEARFGKDFSATHL